MKYKIPTILLLLLCSLISCDYDHSTTNGGKDFIGLWESTDALKVKIEIKEQIREGRKREDRYELSLKDKEKDLPKHYVNEGQYNYHLGPKNPEFNHHPFLEFLHKNSMADTISYLALKNNNQELIRRYKGLKDLTFKKLE